jgi:hypothetical protein
MDKQRLEEIKARLAEEDEFALQSGYDSKGNIVFRSTDPLRMLYELMKTYEQATTWRPISEATEYMRGIDYCLLLLPWEDYNPHMVVGWFNGGWFCKHPRGGYDCYVEPTHFLPLPKPPVAEGEHLRLNMAAIGFKEGKNV